MSADQRSMHFAPDRTECRLAGADVRRERAGIIDCGDECRRLGACGALLMQPGEIVACGGEVRAASLALQLNLWIPDPPPRRDPALEDAGVANVARPWRSRRCGEQRLLNRAGLCAHARRRWRSSCHRLFGHGAGHIRLRVSDRMEVWRASSGRNVTTVVVTGATRRRCCCRAGMEAGGHHGSRTLAKERLIVGGLGLSLSMP